MPILGILNWPRQQFSIGLWSFAYISLIHPKREVLSLRADSDWDAVDDVRALVSRLRPSVGTFFMVDMAQRLLYNGVQLQWQQRHPVHVPFRTTHDNPSTSSAQVWYCSSADETNRWAGMRQSLRWVGWCSEVCPSGK
jgi:hypothetical protein